MLLLLNIWFLQSRDKLGSSSGMEYLYPLGLGGWVQFQDRAMSFRIQGDEVIEGVRGYFHLGHTLWFCKFILCFDNIFIEV